MGLIDENTDIYNTLLHVYEYRRSQCCDNIPKYTPQVTLGYTTFQHHWAT